MVLATTLPMALRPGHRPLPGSVLGDLGLTAHGVAGHDRPRENQHFLRFRNGVDPTAFSVRDDVARLIEVAVAHALTMWIADVLLAASKLPCSDLPSIAITTTVMRGSVTVRVLGSRRALTVRLNASADATWYQARPVIHDHEPPPYSANMRQRDPCQIMPGCPASRNRPGTAATYSTASPRRNGLSLESVPR